MVERRHEILRRQLHLLDSNAAVEGLRASFSAVLSKATLAKNVLFNQGGASPYFECEDALSSDGMFATQLSSAAFPALCQVAALPQRYGSREPSQASYLLPPSQLTSLLERQQVQSALLNRLEFTLTKNYLFYENL